ncbi:MAG: hypothetical protein ACRELC_09455, partial [Gemmatimonadota bacterium]
LAASVALALAWLPAAGRPVAAQYTLTAPWGDTLSSTRDALLEMRERSRELRTDLEQDPLVLYFTTFGPAVRPDAPTPAFPWNAIDVVTDSLAAVITPGNLREADRAYVNYAVLRMRAVRADPDVPCEELMAREVTSLDGFIDGWIVARTLFGGPAFALLDELAFARRADVLPGLIAARDDPQLGGCLRVWRVAHAAELEAYRRWRDGRPGT